MLVSLCCIIILDLVAHHSVITGWERCPDLQLKYVDLMILILEYKGGLVLDHSMNEEESSWGFAAAETRRVAVSV